LLDQADFTLDDTWYEPEVEIDEESIEVEITNIRMLNHSAVAAEWEINVEVTYKVDVTHSDPDSVYRDPDTRDLVYTEEINVEAEVYKQLNLTVQANFIKDSVELTFDFEDFAIPSFIYEINDEEFTSRGNYWD
jgi:hypothetical protein